MKNKIIKYIKFLVSMTLILSLVAPSYASLSASDGSAFVTKAEFDSALADFNSRLTTFEAGINSKIDSQVTSYLDRNGIWNGSVQEEFVGRFMELTSDKDIVSTATRKKTNDKILWNFDEDVTKAGLLYMVIEESLVCTDRDGYWRNYIKSESTNSGNDSNITFQLQLSQNGNQKYNGVLISSVAIGGSTMILSFPDNAKYTVLCFVEKQLLNTILIEKWVNTHPDKDMTLATSYGFWKNGGKIRYEILDAKVY